MTNENKKTNSKKVKVQSEIVSFRIPIAEYHELARRAKSENKTMGSLARSYFKTGMDGVDPMHLKILTEMSALKENISEEIKKNFISMTEILKSDVIKNNDKKEEKLKPNSLLNQFYDFEGKNRK